MRTPPTTTQTIAHEGMVFTLRTWWSTGEPAGWHWTLVSADPAIPFQQSGSRAWAAERLALEAAKAFLATTF